MKSFISMSKETKKKHNKNVKNKSSLNGYKFSGKRYFNANKQLSTKSQRQYVKQNINTKSKQPNKEVDLYQSHLPETPGYIDSSSKANEDTESADRARTLQLTQEDILRQSDLVSASKRFELKLPNLGPYFINYSRSGRYLLIGGNKGHVASIDWMSKKLTCEFQLKETVRAVQFLHNENMFAVAQKK